MTFNPQALYDAVRPFTNQLEAEAQLLRREPTVDRVEQDLIHATQTGLFHVLDLGFLLARIRREHPTTERKCDCGGTAVICRTCMTDWKGSGDASETR